MATWRGKPGARLHPYPAPRSRSHLVRARDLPAHVAGDPSSQVSTFTLAHSYPGVDDVWDCVAPGEGDRADDCVVDCTWRSNLIVAGWRVAAGAVFSFGLLHGMGFARRIARSGCWPSSGRARVVQCRCQAGQLTIIAGAFIALVLAAQPHPSPPHRSTCIPRDRAHRAVLDDTAGL